MPHGSLQLEQLYYLAIADPAFPLSHQREDPSLEGKPFGVGKGVLTTASYEARKYGCSSAMAGFVAKKLCPELIFVPLDFKLYVEASRTIMDVLRQYGETSPASLDEACELHRSPEGMFVSPSDTYPFQTYH